ncbi:AtpZ/AtpI family protein [Desertivirga brevis]|uniref:AtpZ/AtpI family protein n=1 Tax=Desertivirga brevis TaxID=2810310 RepID=UPI001A97B708|nr:AtpZ/AtpI family protein [Pedobacter sp. SYSU D00873]
MQTEETKEEKGLAKQRKYFSAYAKYSAMGFQMFAVIAVFAFIGYKIDERQNSKTPLWTAFLSLLGVFCSLYLVIRSIKKLNP